MAVLSIDFDGVIHDPTEVLKGFKMGQPVYGAVEAMKTLAVGNTLIIHTIWATSTERIGAIANWLEYYDIPYHKITNIKPDASRYIDNKGYHFQNWEDTLTELMV
jgi:hypothetical protein